MKTRSTFQKIIAKTGCKPVSCKCQVCKKQCYTSPCIGTPEDIRKIIEAGHGDKIVPSSYGTGIAYGVQKEMIDFYAPYFDLQKGHCSFLENDLCTLHDSGLKPTEGKLSHHIPHSVPSFTKTVNWMVIQEWIGIDLQEFENLLTK